VQIIDHMASRRKTSAHLIAAAAVYRFFILSSTVTNAAIMLRDHCARVARAQQIARR
jgi:hypothetical protein